MALFQLINTVNEIQVKQICGMLQGSNLRKHADGAISFEVDQLHATDTKALADYISIHPLQFWSCRVNEFTGGITVTITNAM